MCELGAPPRSRAQGPGEPDDAAIPGQTVRRGGRDEGAPATGQDPPARRTQPVQRGYAEAERTGC